MLLKWSMSNRISDSGWRLARLRASSGLDHAVEVRAVPGAGEVVGGRQPFEVADARAQRVEFAAARVAARFVDDQQDAMAHGGSRGRASSAPSVPSGTRPTSRQPRSGSRASARSAGGIRPAGAEPLEIPCVDQFGAPLGAEQRERLRKRHERFPDVDGDRGGGRRWREGHGARLCGSAQCTAWGAARPTGCGLPMPKPCA